MEEIIDMNQAFQLSSCSFQAASHNSAAVCNPRAGPAFLTRNARSAGDAFAAAPMKSAALTEPRLERFNDDFGIHGFEKHAHYTKLMQAD